MKGKKQAVTWKGATAGILAVALMTSLAAGIWMGSRGNRKGDPGTDPRTQAAAGEPAEGENEAPESAEQRADSGISESGEQNADSEVSGRTEQNVDSGDSGRTERNTDSGISEKRQEEYRVGDIMEDGAMYTGGDVEAGLNYIRENPQIWDQIVWH